jgi:2-polyprenyl-3-methyl-5-hydroxy-6-metoxy-1,4-benzoquinol methylase
MEHEFRARERKHNSTNRERKGLIKMVSITKITSRDIPSHKADHAFGIQEGRRCPYRLPYARHFELGSDVARWAWEHHQNLTKPLDLLEVGVGAGVLMKYTEIHPGSEYVRYEAVDIYPDGIEAIYKHDQWKHHRVDLNHGMSGITANSFDVVICDHLMEHLENYRLVMSDLSKVLRPDGLLVVGVPIFPPGAHLIRRHIVPAIRRLFKIKADEHHPQTWSKRDLIRDLKKACPDIDILVCRGFRIASGGIITPLERYRWWWQFNRWLGRLLPSLCIEVQVIARKRPHAAL